MSDSTQPPSSSTAATAQAYEKLLALQPTAEEANVSASIAAAQRAADNKTKTNNFNNFNNSAAKPVYGPQERSESQWRTTKTHSPEQMMSVYRELFFSGFPTNPLALKEEGGGNDEDDEDVKAMTAPFRPFPADFVRDFFGHYGPIEHFTFDEHRGTGSVTFVSGNDAEDCYLSVHLSLIPPPSKLHGKDAEDSDDDDNDGENEEDSTSNNNSGQKAKNKSKKQHGKGGEKEETPDVNAAMRQNEKRSMYKDLGGYLLLYLEFAQYCPFVNPLLLREEELHSTDISRQLMRTFPVNDRKLESHTANHIVAWYEPVEVPQTAAAAAKGKGKAKADDDGDGDSDNEGEDKKKTAAVPPSAPLSGAVKRCGPFYPGASATDPYSSDALFTILKPRWFSAIKTIPLTKGSNPNAAPMMKSLSGEGGAYYRGMYGPADSTQGVLRQEVRVLDLWWEFYQTYVLHKTQPTLKRLRNTRYLFAQKPSVAQEIQVLIQQCAGSTISSVSASQFYREAAQHKKLNMAKQKAKASARGEEVPSTSGNENLPAATVVGRLIQDDVLHGTLAFLVYKWKRLNDPTWTSFFRDIDTQVKVNEKNRSGDGKKHAKSMEEAIEDELQILLTKLESKEALQEMLTTPSYVLALNVIENVLYLKFVREHKKDLKRLQRKAENKRLWGDGGKKDKQNPNDPEPMDEEDEYEEIEKLRMRYIGRRMEDEYLYMEIAQTVQGFATSGSATSIMILAEHPDTFRYVKGHLGYNEFHSEMRSFWTTCYGYLRALWVPFLFIIFVVAIIMKFSHAPMLAEKIEMMNNVREQYKKEQAEYHQRAAEAAAAAARQQQTGGFSREELMKRIKIRPLHEN